MAVGAVALQLLGSDGELVWRADQERAEVARVVGVRHRDRRRRAQLAHERPQPRGERDEVVRREGQDRVLDGALGQRGVVGSVAGDVLCRPARDGDADAALLVEGDRVAVGELERRRVGAAVDAPHGLLADALQARLGVLRPAAGAPPRAVGVAVVGAVDPDVVARRGGDRRHDDVLDADRDRVADLGSGDRDRPGHLVPTADGGRDHRPPAAGRRVEDDVPAVLDGPEHPLIGSQHAVGERVDHDHPVRGQRLYRHS